MLVVDTDIQVIVVPLVLILQKLIPPPTVAVKYRVLSSVVILILGCEPLSGEIDALKY